MLDTETTGISPAHGHRIIEVGCVEVINGEITGKAFHRYINPAREIDAMALSVHGLSRDFLSDKPHFATIADELIKFIGDAELIIHNAPFDLGFLDQEFALLKRPRFSDQVSKITDSLLVARQIYPGQRNSLDALCARLAINSEPRKLHGALLDAQLLAKVYLSMVCAHNQN